MIQDLKLGDVVVIKETRVTPPRYHHIVKFTESLNRSVHIGCVVIKSYTHHDMENNEVYHFDKNEIDWEETFIIRKIKDKNLSKTLDILDI